MPPKLSAGLMLYRHGNQDDEIVLEVLLGHMGGPFWARKDDGAWSIPKDEHEPGEDPFDAAKREFEEELGSAPPLVVYRDLGSIRQPGGKLVAAWAAEADFDAAGAVSNTFELEWPRGSGQMRSFPEIDKAGWFYRGGRSGQAGEGPAGISRPPSTDAGQPDLIGNGQR